MLKQVEMELLLELVLVTHKQEVVELLLVLVLEMLNQQEVQPLALESVMLRQETLGQL